MGTRSQGSGTLSQGSGTLSQGSGTLAGGSLGQGPEVSIFRDPGIRVQGPYRGVQDPGWRIPRAGTRGIYFRGPEGLGPAWRLGEITPGYFSPTLGIVSSGAVALIILHYLCFSYFMLLLFPGFR